MNLKHKKDLFYLQKENLSLKNKNSLKITYQKFSKNPERLHCVGIFSLKKRPLMPPIYKYWRQWEAKQCPKISPFWHIAYL